MIKLLFFLIISFFLYYAFKLGFSVIRMFFSAIFGVQPNPRNTSSNQQKTKQNKTQTNTTPTKKIFTRDEGEYVDFEEIKDS